MTELQSPGCAWSIRAPARQPARRRRAVGPQGRDRRRPDDHGAGPYRTAFDARLRGRRARCRRPQRAAARQHRRSPASVPDAPRFYALQTSTACRTRTSPRCTAPTCWPPRCCRPASATRAGARPASSARSASRWPRAARSRARRRQQLAEVARAAVAARRRQAHGDDHRHAADPDRGAAVLCESAYAIKAARRLCRCRRSASRRTTTAWFGRMQRRRRRHAGHAPRSGDAEPCAQRIMPGKAEVP